MKNFPTKKLTKTIKGDAEKVLRCYAKEDREKMKDAIRAPKTKELLLLKWQLNIKSRSLAFSF
jgi:hypothetical protein